MTDRSQYGEATVILEHFAGRTGRFLDVGAGDGRTYSNTEPLLEAGWSGVMIEPAISQLRWLIENHGDNPNVEIIPAMLDHRRGPVLFALSPLHDSREYSTTLQSQRALIEQHSQGTVTFRQRLAPTVCWEETIGDRFDFVNIDTEGTVPALFASMPEIGAEMVCVEIDPPGSEQILIDIATCKGFRHVRKVGENLLVWRDR